MSWFREELDRRTSSSFNRGPKSSVSVIIVRVNDSSVPNPNVYNMLNQGLIDLVHRNCIDTIACTECVTILTTF